MDNLEMRILEVLTDDARTPVGQIAVMLGRTEAEIAAAIAEMEERRIILKYPALVNWDKVDSGEVEALIEVRVTPQRGHGFDAMLKAPSLKKLALFVAEKLSTIDGVLSTATHFVLKKYKNEGVITDEKQVDRRLKVTP